MSFEEDDLDRVVDALLESYDAQGECAASAPTLPSRESIVSAVEQLRGLLFPGYYAALAVPAASRRYHVGTWLCRLHGELTGIVRRVLPAGRSTEAERLVTTFLEQLVLVRALLLEDARAALEGDPAAHNIDEVILTYPGFEAITVHRLAHALHQMGLAYLPRAMSEIAHARTGIDIHPGATIGRRFFIDHGTGVVIGETSRIGDDVKMYQGVTLGALSVSRQFAGTKRHPTIEDGVVLYAGATVLGGDTVIGKGAVIGGNVWVTHSILPGVTVVETPATLSIRNKT